jgi:hypothetical protein
MKNFIENKVLDNTDFKISTIGPFSYLIHKMSGAGNFQLKIFKDEKMIHSSEIVCDKEVSITSVNLDIAAIYTKSGLANKYRLNDLNAYVLLYNSKEFSDYKIVIYKDKDVEFDSSKPSKGDLFALNLIKPGLYQFKSGSLKKDIKINVTYPALANSREARHEESHKFDINKIQDCEIFPNQGIVFELDGKFNDFSIKLVKENLPDKGQSIIEQLKAKTVLLMKDRKKHTKENPLKKYHKEYSHK